MDEISTQLGSIQSDVKSNGRMLESHGTMLESHGRMLESHSRKLESHGTMLESHGTMLKSHDGKFQSIDGRLQSLEGKLTALDHKMTIEFEDTKRLINLGFENTQMLREEVGRRFDDTDRAHADQKALLEAAIVGLSRPQIKPRLGTD